MPPHSRQLLVLGCSASKVETDGVVPAINLYDGPAYRVLRSFLRRFRWPKSLSLAVLSAKYGLIGGLSPLAFYDQRMTRRRAEELCGAVSQTLKFWESSHQGIDLVLGKDYLRTIDRRLFQSTDVKLRVVPGPIGKQLNFLADTLRRMGCEPRHETQLPAHLGRPLYFLPDWDDFLDMDFDFTQDRFSHPNRSERREAHGIHLMQPNRLCDGVLVSLAQHLGSKGLLKRMPAVDEDALAPRSVREHFWLSQDQWAFGDCGAFSYVAEEQPAISIEQAVAVYDLYEFDLGASVDHIPVPEVRTKDGRVFLGIEERRARVMLTRDNAERFLTVHRTRRARFMPVGVIQGISPEDYARQIGDYLDMGYHVIALGGLVPRSDAEVTAIVEAVYAQLPAFRVRPWVHLLGIFRPKLQASFAQLGVGSFDSASYFRKAWLRSDQNYLGVDGKWYAAIRVPPSHDPRTLTRLKDSGVDEAELLALERRAMDRLRAYDRGEASLNDCLSAVIEYDRLLHREELVSSNFVEAYRRTLTARPWQTCGCPLCQSLGIDIVIFRGLNRNKRRGVHNTLMLFRQVQKEKPPLYGE